MGPQLTLLTPFLNEAALLPGFLSRILHLTECFPYEIEWVLVDSGSSDASASIVREWAVNRSGVRLVEKDQQEWRGPSIGRALNHGLRCGSFRGSWVQVIPADCELSTESLGDILRGISVGFSEDWFACVKRYEPETLILRWYSWLQNSIRLGWLGRAVWTNGMAVRRCSLLERPFPEVGFMEDSLWGDALLKQYGRPAVMGVLKVSARRYYPDRTLRRVCINLLVIFFYRMARAMPVLQIEQVLPWLRQLYLSLR